MSCIFTGCRVKLSSTGEVFSSDAHAVGENLVFVCASVPCGGDHDVLVNVEDTFHYWESIDGGGQMVICAAPDAMSEVSQELEKRVDKFFEAWFATLPQDAVVELDSYEPDHDRKCEACGASPTVTGVKDGVRVLELGLCGPCTWGEAKTADPSNWN